MGGLPRPVAVLGRDDGPHERVAPRERDEGSALYLYYTIGGSGLKLTQKPPPSTPDGSLPRPRSFLGAAFGTDPRWIYAAAAGPNAGWNGWRELSAALSGGSR